MSKRIVYIRGARYEVVRQGCGGDLTKCPNQPHALAVYRLETDGTRRWPNAGTQCISELDITEEEQCLDLS